MTKDWLSDPQGLAQDVSRWQTEWTQAEPGAADIEIPALTLRRPDGTGPLGAVVTEIRLRDAERMAGPALDPGFTGDLVPCRVVMRQRGRFATMIKIQSAVPVACHVSGSCTFAVSPVRLAQTTTRVSPSARV